MTADWTIKVRLVHQMIWSSIVLLCLVTVPSCSHTFVHVNPRENAASAQPSKSRSAILVLTGLRNGAKGRRAMEEWYPQHEFDVFIPDYYSRDGLDQTVDKLVSFIDESGLREYDEVNIFSYMLGAWTLNDSLNKNPIPNIKRVIYDRSPYQEQVSHIVLTNMPNIIFTFYGVTVKQFSDIPYPPLEKSDRQIGIIVECRATSLVRRNQDLLVPVTTEDFRSSSFHQDHDDLIYIQRHHDEMYYSFNDLGPEILSFFRTDRFTDGAQRTPCDNNPFW